MGGWSDNQVREFAKRFAFANKGAWHAYVEDVRESLIDSFVLMIVLGQDGSIVRQDIQSLRTRLGVRLNSHHQMPNVIAEENK